MIQKLKRGSEVLRGEKNNHKTLSRSLKKKVHGELREGFWKGSDMRGRR